MLEERELPERWSAKRKSEIVLRLLWGEDLGELSREIQVPPPEIEQWREAFLSGAETGLKKRAARRMSACADRSGVTAITA